MTYYVVDKEKIDIGYSLLPIATLPNNNFEYLNPQQLAGTILTNFVKKRGVYLWTNKINGHQYIGSAKDLSSRLSNYFSNSYIKYQSSRDSAISLAISKYGLSEFSLQVFVLGDIPTRDTISVDSDHIVLEQSYLDKYVLKYYMRRIALGPAPILNPNKIDKKGPGRAAAQGKEKAGLSPALLGEKNIW